MKCSTLKKLLGILAVAAITAGIVYALFKMGILPFGKKNEEDPADEDDLADFDEDLSDLFDDFNDDTPVIQIVKEEEAPAKETPAEEAPAEEPATEE